MYNYNALTKVDVDLIFDEVIHANNPDPLDIEFKVQ